MLPTRNGSFRLFRLAGVEVFLHWSWFVVALVVFSIRRQNYESWVFNVAEYLALFLIVLMHEFGHSLACRQVGGKADQIILWPLGGVAYVSPPQRPGAMLWSIAAGPLVNVVLLPLSGALWFGAATLGWADSFPDLYKLIWSLVLINGLLLAFNLLPIYPLDGGQIVRSLLWYAVGRGRSLMIAASFGFAGVAALFGLALWLSSVWIGILGVFNLLNCVNGIRQARMLLAFEKLPRRNDYSCPDCKAPAPAGAEWLCGKCSKPFDTFETGAVCPHCGEPHRVTMCPDCGVARPINEWLVAGFEPPKLAK